MSKMHERGEYCGDLDFESNTSASRFIKAENITWKVFFRSMIDPMNNKEHVAVGVKCIHDYEQSNLWSCDVEITVTLADRGFKEIDCHFDHSSKSVIIGTFVYQTDNRPIISSFTRIRFKSTSVIQTSESRDFLIPKNISSEVVLHVKYAWIKKKLYSDKYVLMAFSSFFRDILSDKDGKNNNNEIVLQGFLYKHFIVFLSYLYGEKQQITMANVNVMLEYATRFDVGCLQHDCEEFLKLQNITTHPAEIPYRIRRLQNSSYLKKET